VRGEDRETRLEESDSRDVPKDFKELYSVCGGVKNTVDGS
jgi:hypothetical protein